MGDYPIRHAVVFGGAPVVNVLLRWFSILPKSTINPLLLRRLSFGVDWRCDGLVLQAASLMVIANTI
jgi:hypothetical protein